MMLPTSGQSAELSIRPLPAGRTSACAVSASPLAMILPVASLRMSYDLICTTPHKLT
jgi:hypothetical protein